MSRWADTLPRVSVTKTDTLKSVAVIYPYYDQPEWAVKQVEHLRHVYDTCMVLQGRLSVVMVDDGSPTTPLRDALVRHGQPWGDFLRVFRIDQDIRWNWLAARNIGAYQARADWLLLTDLDHRIPSDTLIQCVWGNHDPRVIYAFTRVEHTGAAIRPHTASFFLTRELFWNIGGYDETLSGHYGTDGDWRARCAQVAPFKVLADTLIRYEYQGDSSTTLERQSRKDAEAVRRLMAARPPDFRPRTLSFPYAEVLA